MAPKLPKTIYVRYIDPDMPDDTDVSYLMPYLHIHDAAEQGVEHTVGVYELKETRKVTLKVTEELIQKPVK